MLTRLDVCVSSLRRGNANLLCIVPISTDDPRRESVPVPFSHWLLFASRGAKARDPVRVKGSPVPSKKMSYRPQSAVNCSTLRLNSRLGNRGPRSFDSKSWKNQKIHAIHFKIQGLILLTQTPKPEDLSMEFSRTLSCTLRQSAATSALPSFH